MGPRPHLFFYALKTAWLASELLVSMVPALICGFCMQNLVFWIRITSLYGSQVSPVDLWMQNSVLRSRMKLFYWSQPSSVVLCIQNSDFSTRITSVHRSQTSPVTLCMQNNEISIIITSVYGSQPSFVVFACKTATLGPELQVSIGPRPHLWCFNSKQQH